MLAATDPEMSHPETEIRDARRQRRRRCLIGGALVLIIIVTILRVAIKVGHYGRYALRIGKAVMTKERQNERQVYLQNGINTMKWSQDIQRLVGTREKLFPTLDSKHWSLIQRLNYDGSVKSLLPKVKAAHDELRIKKQRSNNNNDD